MSNKLWPKKKISWLFDVIGSGTTPSALNELYYDSPDMAWLNTGDLTDNYIEKTSKYVSQQALDEFSALTVFPKDSLVMAMYGATIGKLGITRYETTTNQACCVLSKPREVITKFIFYWLMGHRAEIINLSQGGGQPNISQGIIRDIRIAVPPVELQNKIVTFIDNKFEETNQLIDKKEKMINLLEQQRQSIITEAVTKGLNPNARMKDSGVEWIGEIPEHWEVKPLYSLYKENKLKNKGNVITNVLSLSYGKIKRRDVESNFGLLPDSFETYQIIQKDDIVLRLTDLQNDKRSLRVGLVNEEGIITSAYLGLKQSNKSISEYTYYLLHSYDLTKVFYGLGSGVRQSMGFTEMKKLPILLPPLEEQFEIINQLKVKVLANEQLIDMLKTQIEKLKEYRQSLIYEAVTGKIDVRDMELD
ncbi:restriction endonuclease subunit S [Neobacillus niacini]|uniref:restriction endonuclease subunit S n=1 Tax=Neobacillus niacini TaxID=86668 RepID=UPI00068FB4B3|nr:restriction endonuclease subunit S [Neobacillus niacini]MEC1524351.1 restriction endonuclease subunit S [Neobacillus niacini]